MSGSDVASDVVVVSTPGDPDPGGVTVDTRRLRGYRKRTVTIKLPGDEGFQCDVWINSPKRILRELSSDDPAVSDQAVCDFIVKHNFVCEDGTSLPTPLTPADLEVLDNLTQTMVIKAGIEAIQKAAGVNPT